MRQYGTYRHLIRLVLWWVAALVPCTADACCETPDTLSSAETDTIAAADAAIAPQSRSDSAATEPMLRYDVSSADGTLSDGDTLSVLLSGKEKAKKAPRDWSTWRPDAKRAMWLAIVLPGAGQIYNRKYWKLPIVYGGFLGCIYALRWNNQMYHDYSQAYIDIMDDDPTTESYSEFLHLGATVTDSNLTYYQNLFKKRKDRYRRYRDLSVFALIGVYALSIIDAYVDASLSEFDISDDLSMRVEPTMLNDGTGRNPLHDNAIGLNCSLSF